jgi:hypothetical protein
MATIKLKPLVQLDEKKQAIATSENTNITLHFDDSYKQVGDNGTPELSFVISMSSVGGKEFYREAGDKEEAQKMTEAIRLEFRRALRRFDKRVANIVDKYKLQTR